MEETVLDRRNPHPALSRWRGSSRGVGGLWRAVFGVERGSKLALGSFLERRVRYALGVILVGILVNPASAEVRVQQVEYKGWANCWKLSNGTVDLVVVPQIGRIMFFGFTGGSNVLFENLALAGTVAGAEKRDWVNFGGDKLWPAPQSDWNWPPDPILDRGTLAVHPMPDGVTLHGKSSDGVVFERQIHMSPDTAQIRVLDRLDNVGRKAIDRSVWEICQVAKPDRALLPVSSATGWVNLTKLPDDASFVSPAGSGQVQIKRDVTKGHKYGSNSPDGWVAMEKGNLRLTLLTGVVPGAVYPDEGSIPEVYTAGDPEDNMELELLGPIRHLTPGQSTSIEVVWKLDRI